MRHPLWRVAENSHVDLAQLVAHAAKHKDTYHVVGSGEDATVSTWHVQDMVKSFHADGGKRMPIAQWCKLYGYNIPADANLGVTGIVGMVDTVLGGPYTLEEACAVGQEWLEGQQGVMDFEVANGNPGAASYPMSFVVRDPAGVEVYDSYKARMAEVAADAGLVAGPGGL